MTARIPLVLLLLVVVPAGARAQAGDVRFDGRVCRMNRSVDRLIVLTGDGARVPVAAEYETRFVFGRDTIDRGDLRPGDPVRVTGWSHPGGNHIDAVTVRLRPDVADAIWEKVFPSRSTSLIGRFSVREAKTEFFSFKLPGKNFIRVDARGAYGPRGRVRAGTLSSGDLLEMRGEWVKDVFRASYVDIITDTEPSSCKVKLSPGEVAAEKEFLGQ
jgi:hypothetical protein